MYLIRIDVDGDAKVPVKGRFYSYYFCEDDELYSKLEEILNSFKDTKLTGCFYDAFDILEECFLECGNYTLEVIHDRADKEMVEEYITFLAERKLID